MIASANPNRVRGTAPDDVRSTAGGRTIGWVVVMTPPRKVRESSNYRSVLAIRRLFNYSRTMPGDLPHPERSEIQLTDVLFALSDPERLAITRQLADGPLDMAA